MRLLIAKLASASVQSVSVAMNSEHDVADIATDAESCVRLLRSNEYDLVVLTLSQGRLRARDAIARMRREAGRVPMVVLTQSGEAEAASLAGALAAEARGGPEPGEPERAGSGGDAAGWGWEAGPDLNGAAHTAAGAASDGRPMAPLSLEPDTETVQLGGQPLPLSQAEYRIFAALWERRGQIIPAQDLLAAIYRDGARPNSRVLPVFLFKLRKKLRGAGLGDMIETAVGRGFTIRPMPELDAS